MAQIDQEATASFNLICGRKCTDKIVFICLSYSHYEVIVVKEVKETGSDTYQTMENPTNVKPRNLTDYGFAHSVQTSAVYLAAVYGSEELPDTFELGDSTDTTIMTQTSLEVRKAYNGPLVENLGYRVFVRVYTVTESTDPVRLMSHALPYRPGVPKVWLCRFHLL